MTAPNHLVGGFTFTGIFGSLLGINILSDHRLLPVIFIASLLPDIDHTKSIIGKIFLPISKRINRQYGHRTITHSLVAILALSGVVLLIQTTFFPSIQVAQVFALAYSSHLLLDMITVQGIPLFYPFKKNACVIPGSPELRFRSGNIRHESICLCMFTVSAVFMQPLFADGFWTSYNRMFGTLTHLVSEYHKSNDLLQVSFTVQHGSDIYTEQGYCLQVSENDITILDNNDLFQSYPQEGQLISDFYPSHSLRSYSYEDGYFYNINADSLSRLFHCGKYSQFDVQGSRSFIHYIASLEHRVNKIELEFPNELHVKEIPMSADVDYISTPSITAKQEQIKILEQTYQTELRDYESLLQAYQAAQQALENTENNIEKEMLMIAFSKMKLPKSPTDKRAKVAALKMEISTLKKSDYLRYATAIKAADSGPLLFSGQYERLIIDDYLEDITFQNN